MKGMIEMRKAMRWLVGVVLLSSVLACRLGTSSLPAASAPEPTLVSAAPTVGAPAEQSSSTSNPTSPLIGEDALTQLYRKVSPGIVSIRVVNDLGEGQGSGFVIDNDGHIVTNYHVVEGASTVEVDFASGYKVFADILGTDLDSDLAVLKVDAPAGEIQPVALGDSDKLAVGQTVVAIGNPFGLSGTMTVGIVSGVGRTLTSIRQTADGNLFMAADIIQTDAAINPGNSGGPLINLNGEVIGVNRAIELNQSTTNGGSLNSGIGFAVSINIIKRVAPVLIKDHKYDYPYLGVSALEEVTLTMQAALDLPRATGGYITAVVSGGPADQAGLKGGTKPTKIQDLNAGGDLIIAVDGKPILVWGEVVRYLFLNKRPGDQVVLTIIRDKVEQQITITVGKRP
jgi:2-alkenal reductase